MLLQSRGCRNKKTKEYSNFIHTYFDVDHARDIADRLSVTSTVHLFNGTLIDWCSKRKILNLKKKFQCRNKKNLHRTVRSKLDQNIL